MTARSVDNEDPDRLYTVTGGRSRVDETSLDLVTLIVSECEPAPGMQSEYVKILHMCRRPMAVVEVSSHLRLPVSIVKILLCDLLDTGRISARHPSTRSPAARHSLGGRPPSVASGGTRRLPDVEFLKKVLVGLQQL